MKNKFGCFGKNVYHPGLAPVIDCNFFLESLVVNEIIRIFAAEIKNQLFIKTYEETSINFDRDVGICSEC